MQKIFIIGNLCADPELRTTSSGINVCSFTVAVSRRFAGQDGERKADFFRVNAWRGLADNCQKYLAKGRKVAVVGELQARTYVGNDGETRMSLDIMADEVEFLTPKSAEPQKEPPRDEPQNIEALAGFESVSENDLPF